MNGKRIQTPDHWVDLDRDRVTLDGKLIEIRDRVYLLLYKPAGYLTTYKDPEHRPTVYHLLPGIDQFVFPVGRLDLDTSGLLIMTNDAQFAERIMNPDFKVTKTYAVKCSTPISDEQIERLRNGVELKDGPTRPAIVGRIGDSVSKLEITITEGRNRQVRRMIEAVESKVLKLERSAIGSVGIGDLAPGAFRNLTLAERQALTGI